MRREWPTCVLLAGAYGLRTSIKYYLEFVSGTVGRVSEGRVAAAEERALCGDKDSDDSIEVVGGSFPKPVCRRSVGGKGYYEEVSRMMK